MVLHHHHHHQQHVLFTVKVEQLQKVCFCLNYFVLLEFFTLTLKSKTKYLNKWMMFLILLTLWVFLFKGIKLLPNIIKNWFETPFFKNDFLFCVKSLQNFIASGKSVSCSFPSRSYQPWPALYPPKQLLSYLWLNQLEYTLEMKMERFVPGFLQYSTCCTLTWQPSFQ